MFLKRPCAIAGRGRKGGSGGRGGGGGGGLKICNDGSSSTFIFFFGISSVPLYLIF